MAVTDFIAIASSDNQISLFSLVVADELFFAAYGI